jgi:hypothetical protein
MALTRRALAQTLGAAAGLGWLLRRGLITNDAKA